MNARFCPRKCTQFLQFPSESGAILREWEHWLEYSMSIKLLTEHHLEFLSLKGGCTGLSECTLVKMPHCWKSNVVAHPDLG